MHAELPDGAHGHTAICKWVKDAQMYHPRSACATPPVLTAVVVLAVGFWLFTGLAADPPLPPLHPYRRFRRHGRAPPKVRTCTQ
jgi:hypothetical protein